MPSDLMNGRVEINPNRIQDFLLNSAKDNGDGVLESALMLGGALVAPYGKTLANDYEVEYPAMLAPDRLVDLSTCLFPDTTWAIKDGLMRAELMEVDMQLFCSEL